MDSDSSDSNLVIITRRVRVKLFCKLYWRIIILILSPLVLLPICFVADRNVYKSLYVFLVTTVYWITDVVHPGIVSLMPITLYTLISYNISLSMFIPTGSELFDCLSIMMITVAVENSNLNRRIAIKLLLIFGCSHYRLSFMLFFSTMFLSMCLSDIIACGLMMPLLKAVLVELEKMGILEMHHTIAKLKYRIHHHEHANPVPTDFTIFYFLGIAYSASIGGLATFIGNHTSQIFKMYSESLFPHSPKIEFPHLILLTLPGVLLMEALLYVWMNSYFLGMFRLLGLCLFWVEILCSCLVICCSAQRQNVGTRNDLALEIGMSEEEAQYISTLLELQYQQLGRITFHEAVVGVVLILACILQTAFGYSFIHHSSTQSHIYVSAPSILCVIILFVTPINLEFVNFFKRHGSNPLPLLPSKSCLSWQMVHLNVNWSVLFVIVSSSATFSALQQSHLLDEVGEALAAAGDWPAPVLALLVILMCKLATELTSNATAAYCLLPTIAKLSVASFVNPHYLMLAATLACSLPFHLVTGSPVNAMVAAYVHIPSWKMMLAGMGPSVIAGVVVWLTVALWSKAVWTDIQLRPSWAQLQYNLTF